MNDIRAQNMFLVAWLWYFKEFATHAHPVARDGHLYFPLSSRGLEYASAQGLCAIYDGWYCRIGS